MQRMSRILLISVFLSFVAINEMKDFCESFRENNYRISYGFRRITTENLHYIFIGQSYWQLKYTFHQLDEQKEVSLVSNSSKESDWFGNEYSMAFCQLRGSNPKKICMAALLWKHNHSIDYSFLDSNMNPKDKRNKHFGRNWDKSIGFVPYSEQFTASLLTVFTFSNKSYMVYKITPEISPLIAEEYSGAKAPALGQLSDSPEVVAIYGQYNEKEEGKEGDGMIILFKNGQSIQYCYTYSGALSDSCKPNALKTLIECPDIRREESSGLWIAVIVCAIGIIALIAIIIVVVLYFRNKNESETGNEASNVGSTASSTKSKVARMTTSRSKIQKNF